MILASAYRGLRRRPAPGGGGYTLGWETPVATGTVGDTIVATDGTLVAAYNCSGPTEVVNGVTFNSTYSLGQFTGTSNYHSTDYTGGNVSAAFDQLLCSSLWHPGSPSTGTVTFSGLTVGATYLIQVFESNSNTSRTYYLAVGGYTTPTYNLTTLGYSHVCRFVATSTSIDLAVWCSQTPGINGLQLRLLP